LLPPGITALTALQELAAAGNRLRSLPPGLGALQQLKKLALNGNELEALPEVGCVLCAWGGGVMAVAGGAASCMLQGCSRGGAG
jgi:hypothetical protein